VQQNNHNSSEEFIVM